MNEEKVKVKFSDKHPILGLIFVTYGSFLLAQIIIGTGISLALRNFEWIDPGVTTPIGVIIGSLIVVAIHYKANSPKYRFMAAKEKFLEALKLLSVQIIYWIALIAFYSFFIRKIAIGPLKLSSFLMAIMAGLSEEIIFREISVSYMAKHWREEKMIPVIALLSGMLFGVTHLTNVVTGLPPLYIVLQFFLTVLIGFFFSAVYMRTGSICSVIIVHSLHDIVTFSGGSAVTLVDGATLPDWTTFVFFALNLCLAVFGCYIIRPAKRKEIVALWDYRWNRDDNQEVAE